ncbi:hypothetical protein CYMTET_12470 [Cymbomonas tetramitiformis]|uniref:Uncharacterized protein n=1 Tax=Cymbomonas tetramitiformis TaxID=36881 RepID=A0AAE0LCE6_9CHLO|nr:hypothetical protein CYMTET_12470 [Cymbomonas tetramitiformis]
MRWVAGPPEPFDHGVSLGDATAGQLESLEEENERCLRTGAWTRATRRTHVSRVFLVPKPGTNTWRLVLDFRWLDTRCVRSDCRMETLKKLRCLCSALPFGWNSPLRIFVKVMRVLVECIRDPVPSRDRAALLRFSWDVAGETLEAASVRASKRASPW